MHNREHRSNHFIFYIKNYYSKRYFHRIIKLCLPVVAKISFLIFFVTICNNFIETYIIAILLFAEHWFLFSPHYFHLTNMATWITCGNHFIIKIYNYLSDKYNHLALQQNTSKGHMAIQNKVRFNVFFFLNSPMHRTFECQLITVPKHINSS